MDTLYEWLKCKKEAGCENRRVTLMYNDSIFKHKKACIKPKPYGYSGHYMATIMDEKRPEYYEIDYLLRFIEEEFLCDYYVTGCSVIDDPYSDKLPGERIAYELVVSEKISPLKNYPIMSHADLKRMYDTWKSLICGDDKKSLEIKKLIVDGPATIIFWNDGTKTVTKCDKDDIPDYEKGILYAALKKLTNKKEYNDILRKIDAWSECHNLYPDLFKIEKSKKKVYSVLDKIRAEIENHCGLTKENHCKYCSYCNSVMGVREILEIIDKYTTESMVSDYTTLKNKPQIVGVSLKNTEEIISRADMLDAIGHGTTYTTDELQKIIKRLTTVNLNSERSNL